MILAFFDRQGHQWGHANYWPAPGQEQVVDTRATAGEILRACRVGDSWELERNGRCGGGGTGPQDVGTGPGAGVGDARGSAEFHFGEGFRSPFVDHQETALGSVATLPGSVVAAANIFDATGLFTSGTVWLSAETGDHSHRYEVLTTEPPEASTQNGSFGKASGLGDLEVLCAPAPLGIGGRLWIDRDGDGIHDPTEGPLGAGVNVQLWRSGGSKLATARTFEDGSYAFGRVERLEPGVDCEVRVPMGQGPLRGHLSRRPEPRMAPEPTSGTPTGYGRGTQRRPRFPPPRLPPTAQANSRCPSASSPMGAESGREAQTWSDRCR